MKASNDIRNALLQTLSSGEFCSGQHLAEHLGVSRAAISNHVKALQTLGLDIFSLQGKGYRLSQPLSLLCEETIQSQTKNNLIVNSVVDSTNQVIKDKHNELPQGTVCIAECQTAGRGRRGKVWQSPFGANLYLSMLWRFDSGYQALDGLSLVIGLAVTKTLEQLYGLSAQLKWPNDIYVNNKKLGGVLVEVEGQFGGACSTIIGIGLNVAMPKQTDIDQPWTDLTQVLPHSINRNELTSTLINTLREILTEFEKSGFSGFVGPWQNKNVFANKQVNLINGKQRISGICVGIDERGGLLLKQEDKVTAHYGGEISVRSAE